MTKPASVSLARVCCRFSHSFSFASHFSFTCPAVLLTDRPIGYRSLTEGKVDSQVTSMSSLFSKGCVLIPRALGILHILRIRLDQMPMNCLLTKPKTYFMTICYDHLLATDGRPASFETSPDPLLPSPPLKLKHSQAL